MSRECELLRHGSGGIHRSTYVPVRMQAGGLAMLPREKDNITYSHTHNISGRSVHVLKQTHKDQYTQCAIEF